MKVKTSSKQISILDLVGVIAGWFLRDGKQSISWGGGSVCYMPNNHCGHLPVRSASCVPTLVVLPLLHLNMFLYRLG